MRLMVRNIKLSFKVLPIAIITFLCMSTVRADPPWEQVQKMFATDGAAFDAFGSSVAVSGNLAIIGSALGDGNEISSGSAYVFDVTTGKQLFKLLASDGMADDQFGFSVAVSGNLAVVGALNSKGHRPYSGSAYVFDVTTGRQLFKLLPSGGAIRDQFGFSVAIDGDIAVIGAPGDDIIGRNSGSAYVFNATTGQQLFKLIASDTAGFDFFGFSVAASGNLAVIGAWGDADNGYTSGSAYIFNVNTGEQLFKLLPSDGDRYDQFSNSVALSGNIAVIGSYQDGGSTGSAYVFDATTGKQLFKLLANDETIGSQFGNSVAVSGNMAIIGSIYGDGNVAGSGSAYVFDVTTGRQLFKFLVSDGASNDQFGHSVALSGNIAVIGASRDDDNGMNSGSAYVFEPRITNYLTVEPFPLVAGHYGIFSFVEGLPDEQAWLLYSTDGLHKTFIHQLNITIDLVNPKIALGPGLTDTNGNREVIRILPIVANPINIWFQAVQHENATNFFRTKIVP